MNGDSSSSARSFGLLGARGCIRLRVIGLFDLVLTSDPEQMSWFNRHPDVTRVLDPDASFLHRLMHGKLTRDLGFEAGVLPVFLAREDGERAARQAALAVQLDVAGGGPSEERKEIARQIAGRGSGDIGPIVQQWCGRLFSDDYRATPESYAAGRLLAEWPSAPPWKTFAARLTGKLARAKASVLEGARGDLHCVHATSIGTNNIARTVQALRRAAHLPELDNASASRALARCLAVPPAVLRGCKREISAPFLARPLTRHTLIVFLVARAYARTGDLDVAFLSGSWSGCPARQVVPEMLREAWNAARQGSAAETSGSLRGKPWGRALLRAVSAFEGRAS
jgi:hypothetical protein